MDGKPPLGSTVMCNKNMKSLLFTIFVITLLITTNSYACSCRKTTLETRINEAQTIFLAHIISTKEVEIAPKQKYGPTHQIESKYKVVKTFKGKPKEGGKLIDGTPDSGNCSVGLLSGGEYIIYLYHTNEINICSGSHWYNHARDENEVTKLLKLKN